MKRMYDQYVSAGVKGIISAYQIIKKQKKDNQQADRLKMLHDRVQSLEVSMLLHAALLTRLVAQAPGDRGANMRSVAASVAAVTSVYQAELERGFKKQIAGMKEAKPKIVEQMLRDVHERVQNSADFLINAISKAALEVEPSDADHDPVVALQDRTKREIDRLFGPRT